MISLDERVVENTVDGLFTPYPMTTLAPRFDCHFHTTKSDGLYTPTQALAEALRQKLTFIACTNHDFIDRDMVDDARAQGIEAIPAFELSVREKLSNVLLSIHVTTYAKHFTQRVDDLLDTVCTGRRAKVDAQITKLAGLGFDIESSDFMRYWQVQGLNLTNVGAGHITKYLFPDEPELSARRVLSARILKDLTGRDFHFGKFIRECLRDTGSTPFGAVVIPEYEPNTLETAKIIREEWAICSIAHSHLNYEKLGMREFEKRARTLIEACEINALEVHASAPPEWVALYQKIRRETDILLTFGSDCHFESNSDGKHAWLGTLNPHVDSWVLSREFARFRERLT